MLARSNNIVRIHWLILSCLGILLSSSPAEAGTLTFWRFDRQQSRLIFRTDEGVQPKAQLISNPTRLVIDLPGTNLDRPTVKESIDRVVTSLRVGQFDAQTTRLVLELAPGYTIDPQKIKVRGITPTQWTVSLPKPEKVRNAGRVAPSQLQRPRATNSPTIPNAPEILEQNKHLRVTQSGLFVNLEGQKPNKISTRRSGNSRHFDIYLDGVTLPTELQGNTIALNHHGISEVQFFQFSKPKPWARITLKVEAQSPNWQAYSSKWGGLVLLPKESESARTTNNSENSPTSNLAIIKSIKVDEKSHRVLIEADGVLRAGSSWDPQEQLYQIIIDKARIASASNFKGPELQENGSVAALRLFEQEGDRVVLVIQPASGVRIAALNQPKKRVLAFKLLRNSLAQPSFVKIPVSPAAATTNSQPNTNTPRPNRQERVMVVVDPGHGGKDPGTIGVRGIREKDIILPISQQVSRILSQKGIKVIMTRSRDHFVSLEGRAEMANRADADLFVSIHANAISLSRPDVNGLETYYYQSGRSLAHTIHRNILRRLPINDRRVRRARFYVLRKTEMPAVLVEVGFLTGNQDAANLTRSSYRRQMAEAIAAGILEYIKRNK